MKPKNKNIRGYKHKNFNYLLKKGKKPVGGKKNMEAKVIDLTKYDKNGKSVIRNLDEVLGKGLVFADFNYLLSGKQSLTDYDGVFEKGGNVFIIEDKTTYKSINGGQLVSMFNTAYNTYKVGKLAVVLYRIDTGKTTVGGRKLFDFVVYSTDQFRQYEGLKAVVPYVKYDQTNEDLAKLLRGFEHKVDKVVDLEREKRKFLLFSSAKKVKEERRA